MIHPVGWQTTIPARPLHPRRLRRSPQTPPCRTRPRLRSRPIRRPCARGGRRRSSGYSFRPCSKRAASRGRRRRRGCRGRARSGCGCGWRARRSTGIGTTPLRCMRRGWPIRLPGCRADAVSVQRGRRAAAAVRWRHCPLWALRGGRTVAVLRRTCRAGGAQLLRCRRPPVANPPRSRRGNPANQRTARNLCNRAAARLASGAWIAARAPLRHHQRRGLGWAHGGRHGRAHLQGGHHRGSRRLCRAVLRVGGATLTAEEEADECYHLDLASNYRRQRRSR